MSTSGARIRKQKTDWKMTSKATFLLHGGHTHRVKSVTIYKKINQSAKKLCVIDDDGEPQVVTLDKAIPLKIIHIVPGDLAVFGLDPPLGEGPFFLDLDPKMEPLIEHLKKTMAVCENGR